MIITRDVERLLAYLVSNSIVGFGLWMIFTAKTGSELFTALIVAGASAIAVGAASLVNEIYHDRMSLKKALGASGSLKRDE